MNKSTFVVLHNGKLRKSTILNSTQLSRRIRAEAAYAQPEMRLSAQKSCLLILQIVKKAHLGILVNFSMLLLVVFSIYADKFSLVLFIPMFG